jgi:predicted metal-dependent phosphoesterase TrpH
VIDLHSHTTESDGTSTPAELVQAAIAAGLEALAVTDHDTFNGYNAAAPIAAGTGLDLVCGIELSTKLLEPVRKTVHLLGYFVFGPPSADFVQYLQQLQDSRRDRNRRLAAKLQSMGIMVTLEEVEGVGRNMTGRPHFARLMVQKGYVPDYRAAFDMYLDEAAPGYVDREEPTIEDGIRRVKEAGGVTSIAHPIRLGKRNLQEEELLLGRMAGYGLDAIEAYHSDHGPLETQRYMEIARKFGLKITGGSDFHGDNKPNVQLGTGPGHLAIPRSVLDNLREG